jgi:hypothetical protein
MKWIEIITLRSADNIHKALILELLHQIEQLDTSNGLTAINIYRQFEVGNNLSIHIHWKSELGSQHKSTLGLTLAHTLRLWGLLNHSVWVEDEQQSHIADKPI